MEKERVTFPPTHRAQVVQRSLLDAALLEVVLRRFDDPLEDLLVDGSNDSIRHDAGSLMPDVRGGGRA
ncbi:hypothetical protein BDY21DRAFT_352637 [Lineolata rhizophorae]|uniref:Uncharacterized protein n=1 Tax=Lineolata rhizophorae TaxID=578093 RepID=A0A6A6NSM9_9PEZI|nr:hypothetical protein BDY21DRAFT_352637 [Lineolata rhizophorae]